MAKVYITEHPLPRFHMGSPMPVLPSPPLASQTVAIGGATVQSAAFNADTQIVCVHTDAICSIEFGTNPVATANSRRIAANSTEFFQVEPGHKIAVITNS